jgi:hypothetical protein
MRPYVIRAVRNGRSREARADTQAQAELIAAAWHSAGWTGITINFEVWAPPSG